MKNLESRLIGMGISIEIYPCLQVRAVHVPNKCQQVPTTLGVRCGHTAIRSEQSWHHPTEPHSPAPTPSSRPFTDRF